MSPAGGINPEIERMKIQSTESLQQKQHDHELLIKKMERDDARMETLINMIAPPLQTLANVFAPSLAAMAGGAAGALAAQPQKVQQGGPLSVKCPCGYEPIWVSEETPVAICPNCGRQVTHPAFKDRTGAQPPGGAPPFSPGSNAPPPPG
jgi:ribosomal protein S27E